MAVRFTRDEAQSAADMWGFNCGPAAVAAIMGMTIDQVRPHLGDFERRGYIGPTQMWAVLDSVGARWTRLSDTQDWPRYGLARVQWHGPWTRPGVPARVAYGHTHWVGAHVIGGRENVFDINAIFCGGWLSAREWSEELVPWLLREAEPKASGVWTLTHVVEIANAPDTEA